MKPLRLAWLVCALASGCTDRPLSILPGAPRPDAGAPADLAAPADLGPIGAPAPPWTGDAVAYQIDPMHRGAQAGTLVPALHLMWMTQPMGPVSYPLIANGRVFYIVESSGTDYLVALNTLSGGSDWAMHAVGPSGSAGLAYDSGHVFITNSNGNIAAFDEANGANLWSTSAGADPSPPTAFGGVVYVTAGNQMLAFDGAGGSLRWTQSLLAGGGSSPIVSTAAVFLPLACGQAWAFSPFDGSVLWHDNPNCDASDSLTGVLVNGHVYLRNPGADGLVLDATSGSTLRNFSGDRIPAFDADGRGYFVSHPSAGAGVLFAQDANGLGTWSFAGDNNLVTAPLVVNGYIYVGSTSGMLFALDSSGAQAWSTNTGAPFADPDELAQVQPMPGMAAAESLLVVANSQQLIAYGQ